MALLNREPDWAAERAFLPDDVDDWRRSRLPLLTYESEQPVGGFEVIAFSVAYELELTGLFDCLELSGLPLFADERGARHPLVVAGGPLTFSNPLPLGAFVDVVVLGEAEETAPALLRHIADEPNRQRLLERLAALPGYWVPAIHGEQLPPIGQAEHTSLPARSIIITPQHRAAVDVPHRARARLLARLHLLRHAALDQRRHASGRARRRARPHPRARARASGSSAPR